MHHTDFASEETRLAEYDILASDLQATLNPLDTLEPQQLDTTCSVGCESRKSCLGTLTYLLEVEYSDFELNIGDALGGVQFAYLVYSCAVDISEWEVIEQVAQSANAKLRGQHFGTLFANALQVHYICIEPTAHNTPKISLFWQTPKNTQYKTAIDNTKL